jgi:ribose transport system substrate-binding protein
MAGHAGVARSRILWPRRHRAHHRPAAGTRLAAPEDRHVLKSRPSPRPHAGRAVALAVVVAALAAACTQPGQASPTPTLAPTAMPSPNPYDGVTEGAGSGLKVGYVSYGEQVPFVVEVTKGIREQAAAAGAELVECDARLDANAVAGCMTQLAEAGVQGIIQFQGTLVDPAVACEQVPEGVPVVAIEFDQPPCGATLVTADDLRAGQIAGTAVGEWVKANWDCDYDAYVSFESAVAAERSQKRMEGYRQGFSAICPIKNEQVGPAIDTGPAARRAMGEVLASLPEATKLLVVAVNSDTAMGALDAAADAGRTDHVWASGQGGLPPARDRIRSDEHYIGDAAYFPERFGRSALPALFDLIADRDVPELLLQEPAWLDADTIDRYYPQ